MGVKTKSLIAFRLTLAGALILIGGGGAVLFLDRFLNRYFDVNRTQLEEALSKPVGHPVKIGPYKGLRLWGIAIGPTEFLPGDKDSSSVSFSSLEVKIAPVSTLVNWRPVAIIRPKGTKFTLRPNSTGQYWVAGASDSKSLPKVDLQLQLIEPAKVLFEPTKLELQAKGKAFFKLLEKKIIGSIEVNLPEEGGFYLNGNGYWDRLELNTKARLKGVNLQQLQIAFLKGKDMNIGGKVDGDFQIVINKGGITCGGGLDLSKINLKGGVLRNPLSTSKISINCVNDFLQLTSSQWKYGPWIFSKTMTPLI